MVEGTQRTTDAGRCPTGSTGSSSSTPQPVTTTSASRTSVGPSASSVALGTTPAAGSSPSVSVPTVDGHVGGRTLVLKDGHYGPLYVGMPWRDVVRSGWVTSDPDFEAGLKDLESGKVTDEIPSHCPGYFMDRYTNGTVWVSDDRGIESLMFHRGVRTDRGVTFGTPWEDMQRAYDHPHIDATYDRAVVPLGHGVQLLIDGQAGPHGREVGLITIARADQHCYD